MLSLRGRVEVVMGVRRKVVGDGEPSGYKHSRSGDVKVKAYAREFVAPNIAVPAAASKPNSKSLRQKRRGRRVASLD